MNRMTMHPDGPQILKVMSDHSEKTVQEVAVVLDRKVADVRNAMDWLFAHAYVTKRKDLGKNINLYSNKQHKSECEKAMRRVWK